MSISQGSASRAPSGTELIATAVVYNPVDGVTVKLGQGPTVSLPTQLIRICAGVTAGQIGRTFPYDGDGNFDSGVASNGLTIQLDAAGIPTGEERAGCLLIPTAGAAVGLARQITSWDATNRVATINRAWVNGVTPVTGNAYVTMVPSLLRADVIYKAEYNVNSVSAGVMPIFFDYPETIAPTPAARAPISYCDAEITLDNLAMTANPNPYVATSGYFHSRARRQAAHGAFGFKLYLHSLPGGTVSLWAGGV